MGWNVQSIQIQDILSANALKRKLKNKEKSPKYYNSGNRTAQITHARMRMNCSNLNDDMVKRYLSLNRACSCGHDIENAEHYLKECPNYNEERRKYNLSEYSVVVLLYGDDTMD